MARAKQPFTRSDGPVYYGGMKRTHSQRVKYSPLPSSITSLCLPKGRSFSEGPLTRFNEAFVLKQIGIYIFTAAGCLCNGVSRRRTASVLHFQANLALAVERSDPAIAW